MKKLFPFFFTLIVVTAVAQTKSAKTSPPLKEVAAAEAGMSAERLARIDMMCREAIAKGEAPGMVALVARKGKII